jgi:hypothetical protein
MWSTYCCNSSMEVFVVSKNDEDVVYISCVVDNVSGFCEVFDVYVLDVL